jgi:hypothetical protein
MGFVVLLKQVKFPQFIPVYELLAAEVINNLYQAD